MGSYPCNCINKEIISAHANKKMVRKYLRCKNCGRISTETDYIEEKYSVDPKFAKAISNFLGTKK